MYGDMRPLLWRSLKVLMTSWDTGGKTGAEFSFFVGVFFSVDSVEVSQLFVLLLEAASRKLSSQIENIKSKMLHLRDIPESELAVSSELARHAVDSVYEFKIFFWNPNTQ